MSKKIIEGWKEDFVRLAYPYHSANDISYIVGCKKVTIVKFIEKHNIKKESYLLDTNRKINKLTVIEKLPHKSKNNIVYKCLCDCGKYINVRSTLLKGNIVKQCKRCNDKNSGLETYDYKGTKKVAWSKIKSHAYERGIEFNISIEKAYKIFEKQNKRCKFTNLPISLDCNSSGNGKTASLDRIDKNKGYEEGNVQWVHTKVNFMKNSLSDEEFISMCKLVAENAKNRLD